MSLRPQHRDLLRTVLLGTVSLGTVFLGTVVLRPGLRTQEDPLASPHRSALLRTLLSHEFADG